MKKLLLLPLLFISLQAFAEPQAKMQTALYHLQQAKMALKQASHDKGGHRKKAMDNVQRAINQVRKGIKFDNKKKKH
jgi:hypothetical protein